MPDPGLNRPSQSFERGDVLLDQLPPEVRGLVFQPKQGCQKRLTNVVRGAEHGWGPQGAGQKSRRGLSVHLVGWFTGRNEGAPSFPTSSRGYQVAFKAA